MAAEDVAFDEELAAIQQEFDTASFSGLDKHDRRDAFDALVDHAESFGERYPSRVEAVAWNGIVLSTYAGEVGAFSAMKYAKAAREVLHQAESMAPEALDGALYASLGALYSKVPGGLMGFGDEDTAARYFEQAIEVDPDNLDSNFFYGEFLLDQERYADAETVLNRALYSPAVASRPLFDVARRNEITSLLAELPRSQ
jgi:tetratricopeptide (TPR) repeat protein